MKLLWTRRYYVKMFCEIFKHSKIKIKRTNNQKVKLGKMRTASSDGCGAGIPLSHSNELLQVLRIYYDKHRMYTIMSDGTAVTGSVYNPQNKPLTCSQLSSKRSTQTPVQHLQQDHSGRSLFRICLFCWSVFTQFPLHHSDPSFRLKSLMAFNQHVFKKSATMRWTFNLYKVSAIKTCKVDRHNCLCLLDISFLNQKCCVNFKKDNN